MGSGNGVELAVFLIKSHFGHLVSKVCECLLKRGTLSLQELVRFADLDPDDKGRSSLLVRNCLLVLIQHNCVQAFSLIKTVGDGAVTKTHYMALFDNIIHRMRFVKFLDVVNKDLGIESETLLEGLLQNGRLTFDQLVQWSTTRLSGATRDVRTSFNKLVHAQYVERCPRPDPSIAPNPDDETTTARRRNKVAAPPTIEQQAMIAAALSDAERFAGISDAVMNTDADEKVKDHHTSVSAGNKRKHEDGNDEQTTISENEILWRANSEKFVHCLKKKTCVENVRLRYGNDAGIILEAMIESNSNQNAKDMNSVTASMDSILEGVRGKPGGTAMTVEHIRIILHSLCAENSGDKYTIDLKGIIETCQNDEVEALVLKRFGKDAYRIFRLLVKKAHLVETDQVADITFVDKKEAQRILYKLWEAGYLDMKKAEVNGGFKSSYFLWKVKKEELWDHILNDMYHGALNLTQRAAHMVEQDPQILQAKQTLPVQIRKEKTAQCNRWMILQSSLSKLDDALMLFGDF